jgi:chaperonin GroES
MSYQLLEEMDGWEEAFDKMLIALPIVGCMFKKTYYDPIKQTNASELIYPKDLVVDYYTKDMETCPRATHELSMSKNELKIMSLNGIYLEQDFEEPVQAEPYVNQQIQGTTTPSRNSSTPRKILEQHRYYDLDGDGLEEPYIVTVDYKSRKVLRVYSCYNPEKIKSDGENVLDIPKKQYFTKYGFVPSVDGGFYDIGFGALLSPINDSVDTLINQLLDAGTLANNNSGFIARSFRTKGGTMRFRPFEWKTVQTTGDDLKKSIFPLPVREPSNVLFQLLGLLINAGQRLAGTIDSMVGENPGQNQKATTTMAVLEQGAQVFNAIHKRIHRAFRLELRKLFLLNAEYLDGVKYFNIIDPRIEMNLFAEVSREDYNPENMNIIPAADSNAPTQQTKLAKATALMELLPTGLIDEVEAVSRILEALEIPGVENVLKQPQPPQPDFETQLKMQQFQHESFMREREFELEVLKVQQQDVKIQAETILALAKAEAEENGPQLELYKNQLNALVNMSKQIGDQMRDKEKEMKSASGSSE